MGRALPILAITGAAFAFFASLVLSQDAAIVLAIIGITAAVFLFLQKEMPGYVTGGLALVLSVLGALGVLSNVSIGTGGDEAAGGSFGISVDLGRALLISAMMMPIAAIVWMRWGELESWVQYLGAGAAALTVVLAFGMMGQLGDQSSAGGFIVGFAALATGIPAVMVMREE